MISGHSTESLQWLKLPLMSSFQVLKYQFSSFSHSVVSDSLWHHELQHASLPCPSLSSGVCLNSCPLSQWCHPTVSSSVAPFSSCLQSFSASRFQQWVNPSHQVAKMSELQLPHQSFRWVSGLISLTLKSLLQHHSSKASILLVLSFLYGPTLISVQD